MQYMRPSLFLLAAALCAAAAEGDGKSKPKAPPPKPRPYALGDRVKLHKHSDLSGGAQVDLDAAVRKSTKGVVLFWQAPKSPACRKLLPEVKQLREKYAPKGWRFYAVFSGSSRGPKVMDPDEHRIYYKLARFPFPVLDDRKQRYLKPFGLELLPTFAVITKDRRLRYVGSLRSVQDKSAAYLTRTLDLLGEGKDPPAYKPEAIKPYGSTIR